MSEILSYNGMKKIWWRMVLLENPEATTELHIKEGEILWHSKDRDEVYRKGREWKPKHSAILYLGDIPKDIAVVLWNLLYNPFKGLIIISTKIYGPQGDTISRLALDTGATSSLPVQWLIGI